MERLSVLARFYRMDTFFSAPHPLSGIENPAVQSIMHAEGASAFFGVLVWSRDFFALE